MTVGNTFQFFLVNHLSIGGAVPKLVASTMLKFPATAAWSKPLRTNSAPEAKPCSRFKMPRLQMVLPCQITKPSALVNLSRTELIQEMSTWTSEAKSLLMARVCMDPGCRVLGFAETCRRAASSSRPPTHGIDQARAEKVRAKTSLTWRKLSTSPVVVALL